ncbi:MULTISPECIES: hypothetical protein [unclassified Burkholderia]|uniref:hypothetical protein n=1 Tax=unclassified Burkholderia TaxID=2613784 RepID=UPI000F589F05|nr:MULTISPECIES: hypothetical protein [unclassified Burkholderia]RQR92528.1 hypothetical protein DIE04_23160 [Burkholderia sp. Bp8994]RQS30515.1 hypothetical protein DIE05_10605 [Burkholderia sp. Bp8995]RQS40125.1 hypothetical protein DIE01_15240 [Burkholderia sp. Bp8990]RQS48824.1 hypothetical protein DIE00_10285 [Burkholderia sp. Bp8989]
MPSIVAGPADLPPSPVAAETRMVHDVATLQPSDYRSADGSSWVIATLTPAPDSGENVTGNTYFDTAKRQTVAVPDARRRYANRGTWQVVASSSPSVPATGRYDWLTLAWLPINGRPLPQTPEHLYSPFIRGGTIVYRWNPAAQGGEQFGNVRMIFPAWQRQVADVLRGAPGDVAQAAAAPASALDRVQQDGNPMAAVLDFAAALHEEPADRIAARLPALLRASDLHEVSAIVFQCIAASREADRPRFVEAINGSVTSIDDGARLLAIAYGAFAAGRAKPRPFSDAEQAARINDVFAALKQRTSALGVPAGQGSPWYEFFTAYRLGGAPSGSSGSRQ